MPAPFHTAVIGAGMAGLTCAAALQAAGVQVTVLDKSRGLGGRLATRRTPSGNFDHGAPEVQATTPVFREYLESVATMGAAARHGASWVGLPGTNALLRPLAEGLAIHHAAEVTGFRRTRDGWQITGPGVPDGVTFGRIVLALPQPQALRLCADLPLAADIASVAMRAVWTGLFAFADRLDTGPLGPGPIASHVRDSIKPGRSPLPDRHVVHASEDWTRAHLERDKAEVAPLLLAAFLEQTGLPPVTPLHADAHRWRFGLTTQALGAAFVTDADRTIGLCGDWCLGADAEAAFTSGRALATALLDAR